MKKALFILILAALLVVSVCGVALAKPPGVEAQEDSEEISVKGTGSFISVVSAMVKDEGNLRVTIGGSTQTKTKVEYVSGRVYLQRWDGYGWKNVTSRLFYRFNHFYACGEKSLSVTPGYYRAHSIHYAEHGGQSHTMYVTTNYRYIN